MDKTKYTIMLDVATVIQGKVISTKSCPYMGNETMPVNPNVTREKTDRPIYPTIKVVSLGKETWTKALTINGVRELQEHLDIIFEAIHNDALVVTGITIEASNKDWS
jgi:hypothetical protein